MQSVITSKFRTTIPKEVRERLNLSVYHIGKAEIRDIVRDFIKLPGVEIVHQLSLKTLFAFWPEKVPDYGDAIIAALCKDIRGSSAATFDRKFRAKLKKLGLSALFFSNQRRFLPLII